MVDFPLGWERFMHGTHMLNLIITISAVTNILRAEELRRVRPLVYDCLQMGVFKIRLPSERLITCFLSGQLALGYYSGGCFLPG